LLRKYKKSTRPKKTSMAKNYVTNEKSIRPIGCKRNLGWLYWCRSKTVIASQAFAKISMRLVPNQEWNTSLNVHKHFMSIALIQ
jgi:hypothetical protein